MEEHTPPKSNNEKLVIGIVVGAVIGFLILWALEVVGSFSETIFKVLIAVIVIIALLFLILVWFRKRIIRKFFGRDIQFETLLTETQETITIFTEKTTDTLPFKEDDKTKIKTLAPRLVNYLLWSNFRNWGLRILTSFVLGLGGIVTTILVLNQNKILEIQTSIQEQQATIQKAELNRAFAAEQNDIFEIRMNAITENLLETDLRQETRDTRIVQSRIISLSQTLKPYKFVQEDLTIAKRPWSPQRGNLLISLVETGMVANTVTPSYIIEETFKKSNFSHAILVASNLEETNLTNINLSDAKLTSAYLSNTNLTDANLSNAVLENANFDDATLKGTNFTNANLKKANLRFALMDRNTNFTNANVDSARVHRKDWLVYIKDSLRVKGAKALFDTYTLTDIVGDACFRNCYTLVKK